MSAPRYRVVCLAARPCGVKLVEALLAHPGIELAAVFTHARKPSAEDPARGPRAEFADFQRILAASGVPLHAVDSTKTAREMPGLRDLEPYDFLLSLSWRYLVPESALGRARIAEINLHRGRLPEFGGAEPVRRSLEAGLREATITAHLMDATIDTGEVLHADHVPMIPRRGESNAQVVDRIKTELDTLYPVTAFRAINRALERAGKIQLSSSPLRALLLDLDGTTADTLPMLREVYGKFLRAHGKRESDEEFAAINGPTLDEIVVTLRQRHGLTPAPEVLLQEYMNLLSANYAGAPAHEGVPELLRKTQENGWRVAIVTSNSEALARAWLKHQRLESYVHAVVGKESVDHGKPNPEPYVTALRRLGVNAANAIAVEDSPTGAASAAGSGALTYFLRPGDIALPFGVRPLEGFGKLHDFLEGKDFRFLSTEIAHETSLEFASGAGRLDESAQAVVREVWEREKKFRGERLFNGQVLSLVGMQGPVLQVITTDYQTHLAQLRMPELFARFALRPLAVSGLVVHEGRVAFGRRGQDVIQDGGKWELAPSGGLTMQADGSCSIEAQLITELREELGVPADLIRSIRPFLLVEDRTSHLVDIGVAVELSGRQNDIAAAATNRSAEYSEVRWVDKKDIRRFCEENQGRMVDISLLLLKARKLIP